MKFKLEYLDKAKEAAEKELGRLPRLWLFIVSSAVFADNKANFSTAWRHAQLKHYYNRRLVLRDSRQKDSTVKIANGDGQVIFTGEVDHENGINTIAQ